ncbi:methyl-accepting chemotaxis protein [Vibrio cholerae]|uniref:methyl-accepting chemotaxis protein n=1 Tax=Vibrio cholerae TaxID=666 RepID=UPI001D650C91|nr:methyl-accepting chemotaxis protein [Vibrio cholerae]EGR4483365.1 methyl-accepting chemotaxis protein [Vibrio cholerae]EKR8724871.1 methyl-accepting chemotaxis protein [Vibrio cholerae]ELD6110084.1 methyl-accepting chemotaxis protein [Vibrio cholerae]MCX9528828.1 methyl-accepting chemotaxis protein [Vibrio cholerae]GHY31837.1 methyl-accepting chemotaxis protein [Vibrio cholerae]
MDVTQLSQKQKITLFILVLCLGFIGLAVFTAQSLSKMNLQYQQSGDVTAGSAALFATQAQLFELAAEREHLSSNKVSEIKTRLAQLMQKVEGDKRFLAENNFANEGNALQQAVQAFNDDMQPWLEIKGELGFNGKLADLKKLAATIEKKIDETGMVTINSDFQAMIKAQQNYLLQPNEQNLRLFNRALAGFVSMSQSYAMLDLYKAEIEQFKTTFLRVSELSQQVKDIEKNLLSSEATAQGVIESTAQRLEEVSSRYQSLAEKAGEQTLLSILVACVILAVLTVLLFMMVSFSLSKALTQIGRVLEKLSSGDLSQRLALTSNKKDEFNQLAFAVNKSCENLGGLVHVVQDRSVALSGDAVALNQAIDNLVRGQSDVMDQTQRLASATEEVSLTTQQVSHSLEVVANVSKASTLAAAEGSKVISAAIGSLREVGSILQSAASHIQQLEQASAKVDSVMDIINGIAEQTNLLALNAAIEAARAGEQGRGFAVVADEVRSLAVRTVNAVSEISGTIETMKKESAEVILFMNQSEQTMEEGQSKGNQAMQALQRITQGTDEAASQTERIFSSIKELSATSQAMAESMSQISSAMQALESYNTQLRVTSREVETRAESLEHDCRRFTL